MEENQRPPADASREKTRRKEPCSSHGLRRDISERSLGYPGRQALEFLDLRGTELVIDAGSGVGYYTLQLAEKLPHGRILALDRSSRVLAELRKRVLRKKLIRRVEALECDLLDIPLADESVDAAVCLFVRQELEDPGQAVSELFRVIKPGGKVFFADSLDVQSTGRASRAGAVGSVPPPELGLQDMKALLEKSGFTGSRIFLHHKKVLISTALKPA